MKKALILIDWIVCPRNMLLRLRIEDYLKANGWSIAPPAELKSCDLIVLCGCGVIKGQQERSFSIAKAVNERIRNLKTSPIFVVTGCLPPMNKEGLSEVHDGPAFGLRQLDKFDALINATTKLAEIPNRNEIATSERKRIVVERKGYGFAVKLFNLARETKYFLADSYYGTVSRFSSYGSQSIFDFDRHQMGDETWSVVTSTGCLGKCSYCSIRLAKGQLKSRPPDEVLAEARKGVETGHKWVSLLADDNGVYGRDIDINLGALLKGLSDIEGDFGILIDSLGPNEFMDMFDDIANVYESGKNLKLCLPLQHVNTRVLSSMNRTYDVNNFKECLRVLTAAIPDLTISTHLMVGYPGETEEEFEELTEFVRWLMELNPMNEIKHVQFTPNPGTAAAKMDNQVPRRMGAWRRRKMRRIALQHALKVRRENDGRLKQVSAGKESG